SGCSHPRSGSPGSAAGGATVTGSTPLPGQVRAHDPRDHRLCPRFEVIEMRFRTQAVPAFRRSPRSWQRVWLTALLAVLTTVGTFTFAPATAWAATVEDVSYLD